MNIKFTYLLLFLSLVLTASLFAEREPVDRIAVVVGDEIILASEVAVQIQMTAFQSQNKPETEEQLKKLQDQVLEQMISDKLFLQEAKKDTTIVLRPEEIEQALDDQVARIASNFPDENAFVAALSAEGLTLRDLKKRYRSELENQLLRQRYIQNKLYSVSVSKYEVEKFYEEFKDSIPKQPEAVKLAHILLEIEPSPQVEDSVKQLASELRQRVLDGADFATLSVQYSSMGAGANGGDLGYMSKTDVVPEFSRAAFSLNIGDISGVIRTQFGYHVIKCEGKRGEQLRLRHILLAVPPSSEDTVRTISLTDSLLTVTREGADFGEISKIFSADDDTRAAGGELGWFAADQMPADFQDAVSNWREPGEIRGPIKSQFGYHILKLLDYQSEKVLALEDDYDRIKEMARQDKTGRLVDKWIAEIKDRTYIDYRLDE